MDAPAGPSVAVKPPPRRWDLWWVVAGALFTVAALAAMLRSAPATPWRAVPAVALAAVVIASLVQFFALSGALVDQSTISGILSVTNLVHLLATAALAAVAFRLARARPESVAVLGTPA